MWSKSNVFSAEASGQVQIQLLPVLTKPLDQHSPICEVQIQIWGLPVVRSRSVPHRHATLFSFVFQTPSIKCECIFFVFDLLKKLHWCWKIYFLWQLMWLSVVVFISYNANQLTKWPKIPMFISARHQLWSHSSKKGCTENGYWEM